MTISPPSRRRNPPLHDKPSRRRSEPSQSTEITDGDGTDIPIGRLASAGNGGEVVAGGDESWRRPWLLPAATTTTESLGIIRVPEAPAVELKGKKKP